MGKCTNCNVDIPDGQELCSNCEKSKNTIVNENESYLDELLNSVVSTNSTSDNNLEDRREARKSQNRSGVNKEKSNTENKKYSVDDETKEEIDKKFSEETYDELDKESFEEEDESLDLNNIFDFMDMVGESSPLEDNHLEDSSAISNEEDYSIEEESNNSLYSQELDTPSTEYEPKEIKDILDKLPDEDIMQEEVFDFDINNIPGDAYGEVMNNETEEITGQDINNSLYSEEKDDLGSSFSEDDLLKEDNKDIDELLSFLSNESFTSNENKDENLDIDNFNNTLGEDMFSIENMMNNNSDSLLDLGSDLGDVFADTLEAVSSLDDPNETENLSSIIIPDLELTNDNKKNTNPKEKKEKRKIFQELFTQSKDKSEEQQVLIKKDKKAKNAKKVKKAKKTKFKKPNTEKANKKESENANNQSNVKVKKSLFDFLKKSNKTKNDSEIKNNRSMKQKKIVKEPVKKVEEIDNGKISKVAAAFVFTIFALFAITVISGTEIISYSSSIDTATTEFERKRYNKAYDAVNGVEIKDKDVELYDKVMTVMYVNKQLNSYNNYYSNEAYSQALDSLLKGLKRYDKYIALAKKLGIETDLKYVRKQIIAELKKSYHLTEEEAMNILNSDDQTEYSINVHNAVLENKQLVEKGK